MVASNPNSNQTRFVLGQVVATPGALAALEDAGETPAAYLRRHAMCDWGELDAHDRRANEEACAHEVDPNQQQRILSAYRTSKGVRIWIITEWDRSVTTILLPEEY